MTVQRAVASMAIATVISRILGFVRIVVIAALLGTTALGNTFQSTNAISNVLFDLLAAGALSAAIVPQMVHAMAKSDDELNDLVSSLVSLVVILLGFIAVIGVVFARPIAEVMFSQAPIVTRQAQIDTGTILLRFFIPQVVLYGLGAIAVAALTAKKKFLAQVLAPIGGSIFIMVAIGVFRLVQQGTALNLTTRDTFILGIAGTGACVAFVALPIIVAIKNGISMLPSINVRNGLAALSSSMWAIAIQGAAAVLLATTLFIGNNQDGAVVAYQLAFVFFLAPYAIISQSFSTVLLPDLSLSALRQKQNRDFHEIVSTMMTWTYRPMIVATGFCLALSVPLTQIVSQGKASSGQDMVQVVFIALVLGIVPYSIYQAASRIYFAKSNIRLPAVAIFVSAIALSIGAIVGSRFVNGLNLLWVMGIAHTLAYTIAALVLLWLLYREDFNVFPDKTTWLIALAATFYGVVGFMISKQFNLESRTNSFAFTIIFVLINVVAITLILPAQKRKAIVTVAKKTMKKG